MKSVAAILWEQGTDWSVEEVELDPPQRQEVQVRLAASGMCHSDDHTRKGDSDLPLPVVSGHEGAGVIEAVGADVDGLREGDSVVLTFLPICGTCRWCAGGMSQLCDNGAAIMSGLPLTDGIPRVHARGQGIRQSMMLGTFAPRVVVNQKSCIKIPSEISLKAAALVGCGVPTGYGAAVYRAGVQPGDTVLVVGAGGVGSSAVQGARIAGAEHIIAVDPVEFRREQAKIFGATETAPSLEASLELVREITRGVMADRTILTASLLTGDMLGPLLQQTRKGGRVCLTSVANPAETSATLSLVDLVLSQKEVVGNVYGGCNPHADIPMLLRLYQRGILKLDELITRTYSLEQINEGYDDLLEGRIMRGLIVYD